jgi:hypothetical protein
MEIIKEEKRQLTSKERRAMRKLYRIKYWSLFFWCKGKVLRVLVGAKYDNQIVPGKGRYIIAFAFQSPKDDDDLGEAKKKIKRAIYGVLLPSALNVFCLKRRALTEENLFVLVKAYTLFVQDVGWMRKAQFMRCERTY